MSTPAASDGAEAPLGAFLQRELREAHGALPGSRALWLGLASGTTLASAGSTGARHRLARQAPGLLARRTPGAGAAVHPSGTGDGVLVVPLDEEKFLLALAPSPALDPAFVAGLEASASRLAGAFEAWGRRFDFPR